MFIKTEQRFLFIFVTAIIIFSTTPVFAQSNFYKNDEINCLELDFEKTVSDDEYFKNKSAIKGHIVYRAAPFYFCYETFEPQKKSWVIDAENDLSDFNELAFLMQTCNDFLFWFMEDYGLGKMGFVPQKCILENGQVQTKYTRNSSQNQITAQLIFSDMMTAEQLIFNDCNGFTTSKTLIDDFYFHDGIFLPCKIRIFTYNPPQKNELQQENQLNKDEQNNNVPANFVQIEFCNIQIKWQKEMYQPAYSEKKSATTKTANSSYKNAPDSVPAVTAQAAFTLYKKFITEQDASSCRYEPSCSKFMLEAIKQNGIFGIIQGIDRLERCTKHEHSRGLYPEDENGQHLDPVPAKTAKIKKKD